jgi:hypothetical protein
MAARPASARKWSKNRVCVHKDIHERGYHGIVAAMPIPLVLDHLNDVLHPYGAN